MGFLVTDGNIRDNRINITLSYKDNRFLKKIRDILSPNSNMHVRYINNGKTDTISKMSILSFTSHKMYNYLMSIGFAHNKTFNPPNLFPIIPNKYHGDYIRGIVDGDGSICFNKDHRINSKAYRCSLKIGSASKSFLENIQSITNVGGICEQKSKNPFYLYYITRQLDILNIGSQLYTNNSLRLERKYKKYLKIKSYVEKRRCEIDS